MKSVSARLSWVESGSETLTILTTWESRVIKIIFVTTKQITGAWPFLDCFLLSIRSRVFRATSNSKNRIKASRIFRSTLSFEVKKSIDWIRSPDLSIRILYPTDSRERLIDDPRIQRKSNSRQHLKTREVLF
jgi:hypothetical protein